jgi:hypothetical protein
MKPSSKDAYRRLMILKYVIIHSYVNAPHEFLKQASEHWTKEEQVKFQNDLEKDTSDTISSMKSFGLWDYATKTEKDFLSSTGSKMDAKAQMNANWRMEAAIVLMWALRLVDSFPNMNEQSNPELLKKVEINKLRLFINDLILRDQTEIKRMRDIIETWHWRVNTRRLIENNFNFQPDEKMKIAGINSLDDIVRMTARSAYSNGDITEMIDDDFVFKGQAFRNLPSEDFNEVTSIIIERHFALNWLCGLAPRNNWDETPTDT